mmetsp:Transcript_36157/g.91334  ORF Transcript_36157/g.91334 Transcript_36157/m.91334 type:complete len:250 (+) Transcript_36157:744-1493(+)
MSTIPTCVWLRPLHPIQPLLLLHLAHGQASPFNWLSSDTRLLLKVQPAVLRALDSLPVLAALAVVVVGAAAAALVRCPAPAVLVLVVVPVAPGALFDLLLLPRTHVLEVLLHLWQGLDLLGGGPLEQPAFDQLLGEPLQPILRQPSRLDRPWRSSQAFTCDTRDTARPLCLIPQHSQPCLRHVKLAVLSELQRKLALQPQHLLPVHVLAPALQRRHGGRRVGEELHACLHKLQCWHSCGGLLAAGVEGI